MITVEELTTDAAATHRCPWPTQPSIIEEASTIREEAQVRLDI